MNVFNLFRSLVRWLNLLPIWQMGKVNVWGFRLRAPTFDRWLCLILHRVGLMGAADRAFLSANIRSGMTVVDIGANQGLYTMLFAQCAGPTGQVHAFEPDQRLYAALKSNTEGSNTHNISLYQIALGSKSGAMMLYRSLLNSGDNRLATEDLNDDKREALQIQVERLDDVLTGKRIDLIKMDVQGWEMETLKGMEQLLDNPCNKDIALYFEYWPQGLRNAGSNPLEPLIYLERKGFSICQVTKAKNMLIQNVQLFSQSVCESDYINLYAKRH